jgi:Fe2+ or Zn2+ uptake regulation protein
MPMNPVARVPADQLKQRGLRVTPQRAAVLEAVYQLSHPDAEQVYRYVSQHYPMLSLATVYNTLDRLAEVGLVLVVENRGRRYFDGNVQWHDHAYCVQCGRLQDLPAETGRVAEPTGAEGWKLERRQVIWSGVCPVCLSAQSS